MSIGPCWQLVRGCSSVVELLPSKQKVVGSNPITRFPYAPLAQLAEQDTLNVKVIGSIPMRRIFIAKLCRGGGIGRHAWLRTMWAKALAGSTPVLGML